MAKCEHDWRLAWNSPLGFVFGDKTYGAEWYCTKCRKEEPHT